MKERLASLSDPGLVSTAVFGTVILLLSLDGGGYDSILRSQIAILVWWTLLLGCITGLLPLRIPGRLAVAVSSLLFLFVAWVALSLIWTESFERTLADLARWTTYLGVLLLALSVRSRYGVRRMAGAVGIAIVVAATVALAVRLSPGIYPAAADTARILPVSGNRLSFPLNYWNGLGAFVGMGIPLMLYAATATRSKWVQAAAAASIPLLALTVFLTYSRSAIGATVIAVCVFYVLCGNRLARLRVLLASLAGIGILVFLASHWEFVAEGPLSQTGETSEGIWMLVATLVVCATVGGFQLLFRVKGRDWRPPPFERPTPGVLLGGSVALVGTLIIVVLALGLPDRASDAWQDFKRPESISAQGADRLQSFGGNNRYQFWESAIEQNRSRPIVGRGSGTFEFWSNRSEKTAGFVRDAHSLYLETLGELGLIGFLLLAALVFTILIGGWIKVQNSVNRRRPQMAAVYSSSLVLLIASAVDWTWELPVVPIAFLLLVSVLVSAGDSGVSGKPTPGGLWVARGVISMVAVIAIVVIAIPAASSSLVGQSQQAVREGDLGDALSLANKAAAVEPGAATPLLQRALVLESLGYPGAALNAALESTDREPTNWRPWMVKSRLEARTGDFAQAVKSFEEARRLNPNSPFFAPG